MGGKRVSLVKLAHISQIIWIFISCIHLVKHFGRRRQDMEGDLSVTFKQTNQVCYSATLAGCHC